MILWRHSRKRTGRTGVVVRHGRERLHGADEGRRTVPVYSFEVTVVDTNGAANTHSGVFLAELALGTDVIESARRGNGGGDGDLSPRPASCPERDLSRA